MKGNYCQKQNLYFFLNHFLPSATVTQGSSQCIQCLSVLEKSLLAGCLTQVSLTWGTSSHLRMSPRYQHKSYKRERTRKTTADPSQSQHDAKKQSPQDVRMQCCVHIHGKSWSCRDTRNWFKRDPPRFTNCTGGSAVRLTPRCAEHYQFTFAAHFAFTSLLNDKAHIFHPLVSALPLMNKREADMSIYSRVSRWFPRSCCFTVFHTQKRNTAHHSPFFEAAYKLTFSFTG